MAASRASLPIGPRVSEARLPFLSHMPHSRTAERTLVCGARARQDAAQEPQAQAPGSTDPLSPQDPLAERHSVPVPRVSGHPLESARDFVADSIPEAGLTGLSGMRP